jgi:hypothetical protein
MKPLLDSSVELCIELIGRHKPLNRGEDQLINAIITDIKLIFTPGGTIERSQIAPKDAADFATICIGQIRMHTALNNEESNLLEALANDIRIAFGLEGAVQRITLSRTCQAPEDWFWN